VSATVLYMSMSLDGFIAGPNKGPGNGFGVGGHRLHEWATTGGDVDLEAARRSGGVNGRVVEEFMSTGAVVAGRRTFEPAGGWGGDHHDGVPIWVFSRREPGIDVSKWPLVTYVNDVTSAMTQAKEAAGDREIDEHAWLFIEPNAARAGAGRITLAVAGLDALLERFAAQGIEHEPIETYSNGVRHVNVPDPDGKRSRSPSRRAPRKRHLDLPGPGLRHR
jgi:dihydrofolate reductase